MSTTLDRLPPHSLEAEQGVLGCCLIDPVASLSQCSEKLPSGSETFYDLRHQTVYHAMQAMVANLEPVDLITLQAKLRNLGALEQIGGLAYLSELIGSTPSAANLSYYLEIIREKHAMRSVLRVCTNTISSVYDSNNADQLVESFERDAMAVGNYRTSVASTDFDGKEIALLAFQSINDRIAGNVRALPTGWGKFDSITKGGLAPGKIYVVAGRPGTGKTAFAISMLMSIARLGASVGFISLEMDTAEIGERMLSLESHVDTTAINSMNKPAEQDNRKLTLAAKAIKAMRFAICDRPNSSAGAIAAKARRWVLDRKIQVLAIDYLQLVESKAGKDRREQVDQISRALKLLAKELQIPILLLAQVNRDVEKDKKRKPRLSDLRESGSIEQDADFVGFLYREHEHDEESGQQQPDSVQINLLIAKQRGGIAGVVLPFTFKRSVTRFDPDSNLGSD